MTMTLLANRFRVIETLGQGAMGAVYRVADTLQGDREVALKLIHSEGAITPEARLRFKEEFRAMVRLRHPNAIEVYDYGQLDDQNRYLTMEIVDGPELASLIPPGGLPFEKIYPLVIQLLQAMGFVHARHYIHRDVKAQNVRVRGGVDGTLKLMDFGMMIQLGASNEGGMTGTPGYMAPEVVTGGSVTAATDLYAVGCLLFEMITGRLPFVGRLMEVVRGHSSDPAPPVRLFRHDAPERLEAIVAKLLEKEPRARYQDASQVIEDLAAVAGIAVARSNEEQRQSYLVSSELVGRDVELAELSAALEATRAGAGRAVFIGAPAGVGKSRLVQEIALQAKLEDWPVLSARGRESGMAAFEGLTLALRPLLAKTPAPSLARFGPVLARIFPELVAWGHARMGTAEFGHDKVRLHEALAAWLGELAAYGPLVWVFDDLQWADPYSLEAFNSILRSMAGKAAILFLGTFRADETPAGSPVWYTVEEGVTTLMKLGGFGPDQVRALIGAMLRDVRLPDQTLRDIYNATAGNAYFVTEALRDLMERGMLVREGGIWMFRDAGGLGLLASVEETILRRLANLDPGARSLAMVAAVLGRHPDRALLLAVTGLEEETLLDRLEILVDRQFILHEGPRLSFPHDRMRAALEEKIPEADRRALHQRCGEYLERVQGASIEELAYHFSRGTDLAKALRYLKLAGDQADMAGAEAVALDYWLKAEDALNTLDLPDKATRLRDLWWDIGFAAFVMYPRVAAEALGKLCESLDQDPAARREQLHGAFTMRAVAQGFAGRPKEGLVTVQRALALVDVPGSPSEGATLIARTSPLMSAGRVDEVIATAKQALAMLQVDLSQEPPGTRAARVGAIAGLNAVCYQGVQPDTVVRDSALAEAAAQGDPEPFTVFQFFGIWFAWTGREAEAVAYIENTSQKCRRIGAPPYIWVLYLRPYLLWQRGEHAEALALVHQAQRYPHLAQSDLPNQLLRVLEGQLHLELGDRVAARKAFSAAEARGREAGMNVVLLRALLGKAALATAEQQWDAGKAALDEVKRLAGSGEARNPLHQALGHRLAGELAIARGRLVEARPPLTAALSTFVTPEQDNLIEAAHVHRALGRLAAAEKRRDDALRAYGRAAAIYHQLRNPYHLHAVSQLVAALVPDPAAHQDAVPPLRGAGEAPGRVVRGRTVESQYESLQRLLSGVRGHLDDE
ncbi:MAG: hypothetical protein JWM80_4376 [Cyanobacteria bacterium RYN_339]|nr:hypothetical protein [Cyanobacteria bacterium RYN_339]